MVGEEWGTMHLYSKIGCHLRNKEETHCGDMLAMPLSVKHTQETPLQAQVGRSWF